MDLLSFWQLLKKIRYFSIEATFVGKGTVQVVKKASNRLLFYEKGCWEAPSISFFNLYQWTFSEKCGIISLDHLRYRRVHLADFQCTGLHTLSPTAPHRCSKDLYISQIQWRRQEVELNWVIDGPNKKEKIKVLYTS